jgi:hypothetical protein
MEDRDTIEQVDDALDAVITLVMAERIFNPQAEDGQQQAELRMAILNKLNEHGLKLVGVED